MNKLGENVNETDLQKELDINAGEGKTLVTDNYDETLNILFHDTKHNFTVEDDNISYMGIIPDAPADAVARINTTFYPSLQEAINAVADNKRTTIVLLKDISENVTIAQSKNVVLNLSGYTVKNLSDSSIITLNGILAIKNGKIEGYYNDAVATIKVNPNAEINLSNTNVSRDSEDEYLKETIELHGTLKINSGKIENTNSCAIWSYTDSNVNMEISGTAEIYSSAIGRVTLYNNTTGTTKITGGKVMSENSNAIRQEGVLEISGTAEIGGTSSSKPTIGTYSGSKTTITGGTITSTGSNVINNFGELEISETAEISGTSSSKPTIATDSGSKTTITGGIIKSTKSYAFYNKSGGTAIITGGTFISTNSYAIFNSGTISVNGATINGMTYGI